jgi:hypothetical protein
MGENNSPFYAQGYADGESDTLLVAACPGNPPLGPDPGKAWSVLYRKGYSSTFFPVPHEGCKQCRPPEGGR